MNEDVKRLLEKGNALLKGNVIRPPINFAPAVPPPPVGYYITHEFFGTHYRTNNPTHIKQRSPTVRKMVHYFNSQVDSFPPEDEVWIVHNHRYDEGCFAPHECKKVE